jgi:oxygen-independent coproporphyrinogen-3 oxidase
MTTIKHIYIHIPFCSGKCSYCNFYSRLYDSESIERYLASLTREIKDAVAKHNIMPQTIYIGGGTPSILTAPQLKKLLQIVSSSFNTEQLAEWTLEGNPGTITTEKAELMQSFGVSRISMGAQSIDDAILAKIQRRHTAAETKQTVKVLRQSGFRNIGLDLIACLPGVNDNTWHKTLDETIALKPQHISVYALSLEPGSQLHRIHKAGSWTRATFEQEQTALTAAETKLTAAGYNHYEVSNFAKDNFDCRHNSAVWQGADYIGFGPAAASRINLERRTNTADLQQYCDAPATPAETEILSPQTDAAERFIFTFRLYRGINPNTFAAQHGSSAEKLLPFWLNQLEHLKTENLISENNGSYSLTKTGRNFADTIAASLLPEK